MHADLKCTFMKLLYVLKSQASLLCEKQEGGTFLQGGGRLCGDAGFTGGLDSFLLFLPGMLKLQIGLSRAINLLLLTSAYSHLLFSSVGF